MKGYIEDEEFGRIIVELRRGMTSVRFAYQPDGHLLMRAPLGTSLTGLWRMVDVNRDQLHLLPHPVVPDIFVGQVIECFRCKVVIDANNSRPRHVGTRWEGDILRISVHADEDLSDYRIKKFVSGMISEAMGGYAVKVLLPYARNIANSLGLKPAGMEIGRGMRKLGHCTSRNVIQLSRNLMFMPEELVRYIILHELAHITHKNHSPQFHALCDKYCGGKEKALERQLRQFRFPILM